MALRKALGPDVLVTRPPGYVLAVSPEQIDARRFERLLGDARGGLRRGAPFAALGRRSTCGAALHSPSSPSRTGRRPRHGGSTSFAWSPSRSGSPPTSSWGAARTSSPSSRRSSASTRSASAPASCSCSPCIAPGDTPTRSRSTTSHRAALDELGLEPGEAVRKLQAAILRHEAGLKSGGNGGDRDADAEIVKAIAAGRVVPVLGLDGGADLASHLAAAFGYPSGRPLDLARVSQYVATMNGSGPLYDELHQRFEEAVEPQPVHRFLAALPKLLRERGAPHQLIVSTRYDLALERAFEEAGEEVDVVTYVASGPARGKFWHRAPGEEPCAIDVPNTYATELSLERRTVLLKLHGAVDPFPEREWESFVITEDDYIDYLGRSDVASSVPVALAARLRRSHFLFIGYEMVDWNLRLVMHRVWGDRPVAYRSWAVDPAPTPLETAFWRRFEIDVLDVEPDAYVELLARRLESAA